MTTELAAKVLANDMDRLKIAVRTKGIPWNKRKSEQRRIKREAKRR